MPTIQEIQIVQSLSTYADDNQMLYIYAPKSIQNLIGNLKGLEADQILLTLMPVKEKINTNEYGAIISIEHSGSILMALKSDLDEASLSKDGTDYYMVKYNKYIKPLKELAKTSLLSALSCEGYEFTQYVIDEVINFYDINADGIWISFVIKSTN